MRCHSLAVWGTSQPTDPAASGRHGWRPPTAAHRRPCCLAEPSPVPTGRDLALACADGHASRLSQSALINRSIRATGRGWPSLAQTPVRRASVAGGQTAPAAMSTCQNCKVDKRSRGNFIRAFYNEGCSQNSLMLSRQTPHSYKILIPSNWLPSRCPPHTR